MMNLPRIAFAQRDTFVVKYRKRYPSKQKKNEQEIIIKLKFLYDSFSPLMESLAVNATFALRYYNKESFSVQEESQRAYDSRACI